jgi:cysteinyl-tRNA synthetase
MDLNQKEVNGIEEDLMQIIIDIRKNAKINKDFATADKIRAELERLQIVLKDSKEGTTYEKN